jgi:hypothetical protein
VALLGGEAGLVGAAAVAILVDGHVVAALGALALAGLAAGLAVSIDEGFPTPGAAVLAYQGTVATVALGAVSTAAALVVAAATTTAVLAVSRRAAQMRRPVPAQ